MKALEVQRHDLSGATDMVLKLGVKQFYTAIVAFSSPSERDAGTKILKEHFKLPGYCARVTSCTPSRDPRAVYQFTVQQAVEVLIKDQARANLADLIRLDLKPDDEFDSVCTRFGMVFWIDAIENNTVAAVACFNLKGAVVPFESPSTKFVEVASWTGGESIAKQYVPRIMQQLHDLFGTQFRYNGLQYCLSEVRQLADHFAGSFLLQIPGGGSRHRGQFGQNNPNFSGLCHYQGALWSTDNFQENAEKVFRWLGHAHLQSRQDVQEGRESREEAPLLEDFNDMVCLTHKKIAGLPLVYCVPHRNPNLTCQGQQMAQFEHGHTWAQKVFWNYRSNSTAKQKGPRESS